MDARTLMASMGFEAFDDMLLRNFNKGYTVKTNIEAVGLMRRLKTTFPTSWLYSNREGALHGYIHSTPWDTRQSAANTHKIFALCGLADDILPPHSTPLIVHHASAFFGGTGCRCWRPRRTFAALDTAPVHRLVGHGEMKVAKCILGRYEP